MERKTLTIKRPTTENVAESADPVIQRRRKQVVVNTQRKPNKPAKTTPTQPSKKGTPPPAKKKGHGCHSIREKSHSPYATETTSPVRGGYREPIRILATPFSQ
ncbi:TPA: hypothetical protein ACS7Z7_003419 [Providencia alcalifaciens]|uniref:hypothetical protein n=1 Tax=Providencia sp. JUb39 TaxID=2724165 RepID=UPI00210624EE